MKIVDTVNEVTIGCTPNIVKVIVDSDCNIVLEIFVYQIIIFAQKDAPSAMEIIYDDHFPKISWKPTCPEVQHIYTDVILEVFDGYATVLVKENKLLKYFLLNQATASKQ